MDESDIDKSITQVPESCKFAVFERNVEALMRLYAPDVQVFDTWGTWSCEGSAAWQIAIEARLTSLGTERVKVTFDELQTKAGRDLAVVSAIVTYAGLCAQGDQLRAMQEPDHLGPQDNRARVENRP